MDVTVSPDSPPISATVSTEQIVSISQQYSSPLSFSIGTSAASPSTGGGLTIGGGSTNLTNSGNSTTTTTSEVSAVVVKPRGVAWMQSTQSSGAITIAAETTSGYLSVAWWDGQVQVVGPSNGLSPLLVSRSVPSIGDWSGASPKNIYAWSGNRSRSGDLTSLSCGSAGLSWLDVSHCGSLTSLDCSNNGLYSLDLSTATAIHTLNCGLNSLESLSLKSLPSLRDLRCHSNQLTKLDVLQNPLLETLQCNNNQLTALSLNGMTSLVNLYCHFNQLSFLDLRQSPPIKNANCLGNQLTSIRVTGLAINGPLGLSVSQNLLSSAALNTLYEDLAPAAGGKVFVSGNPGVSSDDPSIAIAKGYAVYG